MPGIRHGTCATVEELRLQCVKMTIYPKHKTRKAFLLLVTRAASICGILLLLVVPIRANEHKEKMLTRPFKAQIRATTDRFEKGEPINVELVVERQSGLSAGTLLFPADIRMTAKRRGPLSLGLVSTWAAMPCADEIKSSTVELKELELEPGERWSETVTLTELYGDLPPDRYTLLLEYRYPSHPLPGEQQRQLDQSDLWKGRFSAPPFRFRIIAEQPDESVHEYAAILHEATDAEQRLRALWWLEGNALRTGMSKNEVRNLLGEPNAIRDNEWVYRIGMTGLIVYFDGDRVDRISRFEI